MSDLKLAVVGAGHLGRIHAKLAKTLDGVDLVGVSDPASSAREFIRSEFGLPVMADYRALRSEIDAAIVAAPTKLHESICFDLLSAGVHVLVEKPITMTATEAADLVRLAKTQHCVLQVGHVERFNPAIQAVGDDLGTPYYLEAHRLTPYTFRSADVGVVMDLMIHDIDLALSLAKCPVRDVRALGVSVFGKHEDIAQARLEFSNGCVANLTASRSSYTPQRTLQVFSERGFAQLDLAQGQLTTVRPSAEFLEPSFDAHCLSTEEQAEFRNEMFTRWFPKQEAQVEPINAILEEQKDFVSAIREKRAPQVTGSDGMAAVAVAERIVQRIQHHAWGASPVAPQGPLIQPNQLQAVTSANIWQEEAERRKAG